MKTPQAAFILGAGFGKRLGALTEKTPKPLLPVGGVPLITHLFERLVDLGIKKIIINTHHCAEVYEETFAFKKWRSADLVFKHEEVLLDTGGGIKNIEDELSGGEPLLVHNGDILSNIPFEPLFKEHVEGDKEVTLILRTNQEGGNVSLDEKGQICDFRDVLGKPFVSRALFSGIYMVEPSLIQKIEKGKVQSMVDVFLEMLRREEGIHSLIINEGVWVDIGSREKYEQVKGGVPW